MNLGPKIYLAFLKISVLVFFFTFSTLIHTGSPKELVVKLQEIE